MKGLAVILIALYVTVINAYNSTDDREILKSCQKANNATDVEALGVEFLTPIDSKASNCMIACVRKKTGLMRPDNSISIEKATDMYHLDLIKVLNKDKYNMYVKILEDCINEALKETDECLIARKFDICSLTNLRAASD